MKNKKLSLIFSLFLICSSIICSSIINNDVNIIKSENMINPISSYTELTSIIIDETNNGEGVSYNWTTAVAEDWCSGAGTYDDPYIITEVEIDGEWTDNALHIVNTRVYWQITDSRLINCIANAGKGILIIQNSTNGIIDNVSISHTTGSGILDFQSGNNTYINNRISNCTGEDGSGGIFFYESFDNSTVNNNTLHNTGAGLVMYFSDYLTISNNTINGSLVVNIALVNSNFSSIFDNNITNSPAGIGIVENSFNNSIFGNSFNGNTGSIGYRNADATSYNNTIYKNFFLNVKPNVTNNNDYWYNATLELGNYYSDYSYYDADDDGFGDTPYAVNESLSVYDLYPIWNDDVLGNSVISIVSNNLISVLVNWTAITGADNYYVYYHTSYITEINDTISLFGIIDGLDVNITGLIHDTEYFFIVSARSLESNTSISNVVDQITIELLDEDEPDDEDEGGSEDGVTPYDSIGIWIFGIAIGSVFALTLLNRLKINKK